MKAIINTKLVMEEGIIWDGALTYDNGKIVQVGWAKDVTIPELREQGFKGFYLAIGAQGGRGVGVPGEDAQGVQVGVPFLTEVNQDESIRLTGRTVVVGGGNVAVDVARTAVRVCDDSIRMFCLESREEMPAAQDEVEAAEAEGITVNCGWGPKEILKDENGKVKAVVFKKCVRVYNAEGPSLPSTTRRRQ